MTRYLNGIIKKIEKLNKDLTFDFDGKTLKANAEIDTIILPSNVNIDGDGLLISNKGKTSKVRFEEDYTLIKSKKGKKGLLKRAFNNTRRFFSKVGHIAINKFFERGYNKTMDSDEFKKYKKGYKKTKVDSDDSVVKEDINTKSAPVDEEPKVKVEPEVTEEPKVKVEPEVTEESKVEEPTVEKNTEEKVEEPKKSSIKKFKFNSVEETKDALNKIDQVEEKKTAKKNDMEERIKNYEEFLNSHGIDVSGILVNNNVKSNGLNKDESNIELNSITSEEREAGRNSDLQMLNNIKSKLIVLKEEYSNYISNNFSKDVIFDTDNLKMRYYTQTAMGVNTEINKIDSSIIEKINEANKIIPVWNKETYRYDEGNRLELEDQIKELRTKKAELVALKEELLKRKSEIVKKFDDQTKTMSDAWYEVSRNPKLR